MLVKLTFYGFLAYIFSLALMQPFLSLYGQKIHLSDLIFLFIFLSFVAAVIFGKIKIPITKFYLPWLFFGAAMFLSAWFSVDVKSSFIKLLGKFYLLVLPVLTFSLLDSSDKLKKAFQAWTAATTLCIAVGILTAFLFYLDRENRLLEYTLFHYGTLPPGNYPRLASTFLNANMLCNYLSVSLMILLVSEKFFRFNKRLFYAIFTGICLVAALTISPGLGGFFLSLGLWFWFVWRDKAKAVSRFALLGGVLASVFFLIVMAISPNVQETSPLTLKIPFTERPIQPSARVLTWIDSFRTFSENPFFGKGIGQDVCEVQYFDLSGITQNLTDAHNIFLSVAAEAGIFGLGGLILIIAYFLGTYFSVIKGENYLLFGLLTAFISAFVYQGIGGSFEDARHLWVLMGLISSSEKITGR